MAKDKVVKFRVTEEEYSNLILKADKYNNVSNYIRDLLEKDNKSDYDGIEYRTCSKTNLGMYILEFEDTTTEEIYSYAVWGTKQLIELSVFFGIPISDLLLSFEYETKHMEICDYPKDAINTLEDLKK